MCKVILKNDSKNIDFIIYNLLFAENEYYFTTKKLLEEVRNYYPLISEDIIQTKIDLLMSEGLIRKKVEIYCTVV